DGRKDVACRQRLGAGRADTYLPALPACVLAFRCDRLADYSGFTVSMERAVRQRGRRPAAGKLLPLARADLRRDADHASSAHATVRRPRGGHAVRLANRWALPRRPEDARRFAGARKIVRGIADAAPPSARSRTSRATESGADLDRYGTPHLQRTEPEGR